MPRYTVITRAEVRRTYEVEADTEKAAIEATTFSNPIDEDEIQEETLVVEPCAGKETGDGR